MEEPISISTSQESVTRTRYIVLSGLLAALLASAAWISFPVGTVPITLQVLIVVLVALLLPPAWCAAAIGAYLALGALGAPVFSGGTGGLGVLFGPTGGYLLGFLVGAVAGSFVRRTLVRAGIREVFAEAAAAFVTVSIIYALGWAQLAIVTGMDPVQALVVGVAPFVALDIGKAVVAIAIAATLRRAGVVDS